MQKAYIPTDIFIRIRPFASSGFHGQATVVADKGVKVSSENKRIENYTEKTITIKDEGTSKSTPFNYAKSVIQPETNQNDFFVKAELPTKINHFLNGQNCACIAFGQTGSGKTHTMFGPPSLGDQINQIDIEHVDLVNHRDKRWGYDDTFGALILKSIVFKHFWRFFMLSESKKLSVIDKGLIHM